MRLFKTALQCLLIAIPCSLAVANEHESADSFSGVWQVTVQPDEASAQAGKQVFTDLILFEEGKMSASACASYGFAPSDYTLAENGGSFNTTMTADGETIQWSAHLVSGQLRGEVVWSKPGGEVFHYTLSGVREFNGDGTSESSN